MLKSRDEVQTYSGNTEQWLEYLNGPEEASDPLDILIQEEEQGEYIFNTNSFNKLNLER